MDPDLNKSFLPPTPQHSAEHPNGLSLSSPGGAASPGGVTNGDGYHRLVPPAAVVVHDAEGLNWTSNRTNQRFTFTLPVTPPRTPGLVFIRNL